MYGKRRRRDFEMKKTCFNCAHFHPNLNSPEPDDFFHVHNYCDAWRTASDFCTFYSKLCRFIDSNIFDEEENKYVIDCDGIYDDFEIGKAGCYRFESFDETSDKDDWMRERFDANKELALRLADKLIEKSKIRILHFQGNKDEQVKKFDLMHIIKTDCKFINTLR